jgi:Tol biopolymer transport system component
MQLTKTQTSLKWRTAFGRPSTFGKLAATATAVAAISVAGLTLLRPPTVSPGAEPGIFAPVSGRILSGVWGVDPNAVDPGAPSRSTSTRLGLDEVLPVGWSSDGTELLFMRKDPTDRAFPYATHLYILHADGTETQLHEDGVEMEGATIAPDGSRVVFAVVNDGLYVVDAEGGQPRRIAADGREPTFSPDGTQIAYLVADSISTDALWVADADGGDASQVLAALTPGVSDLAWSPTGDRIAIGNSHEDDIAIYTVAPDGSDLKTVITGGMNPYWSPDGSQIAYLRPYGGPDPGLAIADADGSNVREFGFGASGPWHPGTLIEGAGG